MFFIFSKILSFIISPIIWVIVLIIFAFFAKKPNRKRNLIIFAFAILLIFSNDFLLNEALRKWEIKPDKTTLTEKFDYVIVLGGFSKYDTAINRMQLTGAGDRIWQTLRIYKEKNADKIFISGGSGKLMHQDETEADKAKIHLLALQIPEKDIITESLSKNTHENAEYTMGWIKKHHPGARCLLVTSASHMRRALGCFKKYDPTVVGFVADIGSKQRKFDVDILIKPNAYTLNLWDGFIKEMIGFWVYKIMGYI